MSVAEVKSCLLVADIFFAVKVGSALSSLGFGVSTVETHQQALETLSEKVPDLIVLDLNLDACDWRYLIKQVRASPNLGQLPILAFNSHKEVMRKREALDLGCDLVVSNAEIASDLQSVIRKLERALPVGSRDLLKPLPPRNS